MSYLGSTKIGAMYLGETSIGKAYLGNDLVFQKGGVQPVTIPYIRGGADGSYIDTGITADNTTKVMVYARNYNVGSGWLFGSRVSSGNASFGLGSFTSYGGCWQFDFDSTNLYYDIFDKTSNYHCYELSSDGLSVDGVVVQSITASTFDNGLSLQLFGMNTNGTHGTMALPADICACKIYKNGVLVRDFTAVNSPSVGLYDAVSETLFTNAGSGSFTYGTFNQNAYTPLEYIECDANQYFDSGIHGTKTLPVVFKFRIVGTSVSYPGVFGTFRSGVSGSYFMVQLADSSTPNRYLRFYIDGTAANVLYDNSSSRLTGRDVVFVKDTTTAKLFENTNTLGSKTFTASAGLSTPDTLLVGAFNYNQAPSNKMAGRIYYSGFGAERNFVPAKKGGKAGMYDTYNDVFYPSESGTDFIEGPTI